MLVTSAEGFDHADGRLKKLLRKFSYCPDAGLLMNFTCVMVISFYIFYGDGKN
jgi:hypothetical protein